jgi:hypothetical protein
LSRRGGPGRSGFDLWKSWILMAAFLKSLAGYYSRSSSWPVHLTWYFNFFCVSLTMIIFSISYSSLPLTSIVGVLSGI